MGKILLFPIISAYKIGIMRGTTARQFLLLWCFFACNEKKIREISSKYATERIPKLLMPHALEKIRWHQAQGDTIAIVSASLDLYLRPWCKEWNLDLICTDLHSTGKIFSGFILGKDCTGEEKAKRVRSKYNLSQFNKIYAYGDTIEDVPLIKLAHEKIFRWEKTEDINKTILECKTASLDPDKRNKR